MAYSRVTKIGDGVSTQFTVNFALDYLDQSHVTARVGTEVDGLGDPVYRTITFLSTNLMQISGAPAGIGVKILFERTIPKSSLIVDFNNGDVMDEVNLDTAQKQAMMAVQEVLDGRFAPLTEALDFNGNKGINVGTPTASTDAATKGYVDDTIGPLVGLGTEIAQIAAVLDEVVTVAGIDDDVTTVAGLSSEIAVLAGNVGVLSGTASALQMVEDKFTGNGVLVNFTLSTTPVSEENVDVWIGGAIQSTTDYSVSGNTLSITPAVGNSIPILVKTRVQVSAHDIYTARDTASAAAISAAASAAAAALSLDIMTDLYLGSKSSSPTLDNDGNALQSGALYFNTTTKVMMAYDLGTTTWVAAAAGASNASGVSFSPTGTLASTNVQSAIAEAASEAVQKSGDIMTGTLETRRTNNANHHLMRMTGETGLTNDLIATAMRRQGNDVVRDTYHYGSATNIMSEGPLGVGFKQTNPQYPIDVLGDSNVTGEYRKNGVIIPTYRQFQYMHFGLLPELIDANTIRIFNGGMVLGGVNPTKAYGLDRAAGYRDVALTVTGAGGRDTGTLASFNNQTAYLWFIPHDTDPTLNDVMFSLQLSASLITMPTGYTRSNAVRIPVSFVYRTSGGFQPFHIKGGRPWSVHYTGWDSQGTWNLTGADNTAVGTSYVTISAATWVPNNARLVRLRVKLTGTAAGGAYVSVPGISDDKLIGWINASGHTYVGEFEMRVSSAIEFQLKADTGVNVSLIVVEYTMSDDV